MDGEISFNFLRYYTAEGFLLIQFFSIYHREFASIIAVRAVVLCLRNSLHESWNILKTIVVTFGVDAQNEIQFFLVDKRNH